MCDKNDYIEICKIPVNQINKNRCIYSKDSLYQKPLVFIGAKGLPITEVEELEIGLQGTADGIVINEDGTTSFIDFKISGFNFIMPERK